MFTGWFSEKPVVSGDKHDPTLQKNSSVGYEKDQSSANKQRLDSASGPGNDGESVLELTPHDAIVKSINQAISEVQLVDSSGNGFSDPTSPEPPKTRSRPLETAFDPFSGQSIGNYATGEFEESEDDLWTHLTRIRDLQSEIAMMHSRMESLGGTERTRRTEQSADEEAVNVEEEAKAAKAAEFAELADRFNGKKDAIDAIMVKLETLSHAINDFHSSRKPIFQSTSLDVCEANANTVSRPEPEGKIQDHETAGGDPLPNRRIIVAETHDTLFHATPESTIHSLDYDRELSLPAHQ